MLKNTQIAAIVIIIVALALAIVIGTQNQSNLSIPKQVTADAATKITYYNDGDTWLHQNVIYENVTLKNGSIQTFYSDMYIKPHSSITVDLSNLAGYGNQKLPSDTELTILTWKEVLNETINAPTADLEMRMQGWSNTLKPQPYDRYYIIKYPGLTLNNLPDFIKNNKLYIGTDLNQLKLFLEGKGVHEQILLKVDSEGRVYMIFVEIPELCKVFIIDPFKNINMTEQTTT
jgi:hypothetical protein